MKSERDEGTKRTASFISACAFVDAQYGTDTDLNSKEFDDPYERNAHRAHAAMFGWKEPEVFS